MDKEQKLREFFEMDRFVKANRVKIVYMNENESCCEVNISENHLNADDVVQGGMIYTLADFTFACLVNFRYGLAVTQTASITYLRPAKCKLIKAVARELSATKRNSVCEVVVYDENNETIAICQINGFIKSL